MSTATFTTITAEQVQVRSVDIRNQVIANVQSPFTPIRTPSGSPTPTQRLTTVYTTANGETYIIVEHHNRNHLTPNSPDITIRYVRLCKTSIIHRHNGYSIAVPTDKAIVGKALVVNKHELRYVDKQVCRDFYTNYILEYRDCEYV